MKKIISVLLCIALTVLSLCACNSADSSESDYSDTVIVEEVIIKPDETDESTASSSNIETSSKTEIVSSDSSAEESSSQNTASSCLHNYTDIKIEQTAELFKAGVKRYTCEHCGDSYTAQYPVEKIKILSLGNSYSQNSMWQLYDLCKQAGVKEVDIAIMYIAGCSLDKHWEGVQNNSAEYQLYRNNSGEWEITENYTIEKILAEKDWNIISLQQKSDQAGDETKFTNLDNMVNYVSNVCPDATLLWNMTWPYTNNSKWMSSQQIYNCDDTTMYKKIAECTQNIVAKNEKIKGIVPVGTAVMNARTSKLKAQMHLDDGSHLSEDIGYYVAAYTWLGYLTGMPLYEVNLVGISPTLSKNIGIIRESAENALENPYQITQSYYTD